MRGERESWEKERLNDKERLSKINSDNKEE
jgi:hypothetical protein